MKSLVYTENTDNRQVGHHIHRQPNDSVLSPKQLHTYLTEKIRRKATELEQTGWKNHFCWVKAHVGILGNELTDTLAKDAAPNLDITECYNKVPKSVVKRELGDRSVDKWQRDWNRSTKGKITKDYFPIVAERLKMKITTTHNFTIIVTGHGNIKAYLYRFKILETPTCPCGETDQTTDHLLYECDLLHTQRDTLTL